MNPIQRGQQAAVLLQDPLVKETLETIEEALVSSWKDSSDSTQREELYYTYKGLDRFKALLTTEVENGEAEIAMKEKYGE